MCQALYCRQWQKSLYRYAHTHSASSITSTCLSHGHLKQHKLDHVTILLQAFWWSLITSPLSFKFLITAHKALRDVAPASLSDLLSYSVFWPLCSATWGTFLCVHETRIFLIYKPLYMPFLLSGIPYSPFIPQLAPSPPLCLILNVTPRRRVFLWPHYVNRPPHNSSFVTLFFLWHIQRSSLYLFAFLIILCLPH